MTIGARIKQWRAEKNLKQDAASSLLGISFSTYQKYEMDISKPGSDALEAFAKADVNINWLITGKGPMLLGGTADSTGHGVSDLKEPYIVNADNDAFSLIQLYDVEASAGNGCLVDQELKLSQMAFRRDWLKLKGLQPNKCALIKAKGDSMEPTIYDGDLLLVDTSIDSIKDDSIYIIQADHHLSVKRIQQDFDGSLVVISDNPRYKQRTIGPGQAKEVKIAGRVRWYGHEI